MNPWSLVVAVPLVIVAPTMAALIWRRVSRRRSLAPRHAWAVGALGLLGGVVATRIVDAMLALTGLSVDPGHANVLGALLATLLLIAPLEHGLEVLSLMWLVRRRVIDGPHLGVLYAACAGAGFAVAVTAHRVMTEPLEPLGVVRVGLGAPAHVFFASVWGFALGSGHGARRGRWFPAAWVAAAVLHGLYSLVVFGLPPGALVTVAPLAVAMAGTAWVGLRDAGLLPSSNRSLLGGIEPPSIEAVRRAFSHRDRPLMPHWIALAALVTLGLMMTSLAGSVLLGHRIGIDFALAEQGDFRATAPLALLGAGVLAAFPIAGFLVARATGTTSVLEPAVGALVAVALTVAGLSVTAPITVVFALAAAPVALALACVGAWLGLST